MARFSRQLARSLEMYRKILWALSGVIQFGEGSRIFQRGGDVGGVLGWTEPPGDDEAREVVQDC